MLLADLRRHVRDSEEGRRVGSRARWMRVTLVCQMENDDSCLTLPHSVSYARLRLCGMLVVGMKECVA